MSTEGNADLVEGASPDDGLILRSRRGRRIVAWGCTFAAVALLLWNMPVPRVRGDYREVTSPAYRLVHLDQGWALFAPFVAQESWFVHIEIIRIDGTTEIIEFPDGDPWIGTFRAYRWSAYEEEVVFDQTLGDDALQ